LEEHSILKICGLAIICLTDVTNFERPQIKKNPVKKPEMVFSRRRKAVPWLGWKDAARIA